jgi:hypothetical protein
MALPALPENNTDRLFLYYSTGGGATAQEHVMTIRYNASLANPSDIMSDLGDSMGGEGMEAQLFQDWQFLRGETQAEGSQFRFPISIAGPLTAILGTGLDNASPTQQAREVRLIGRGNTSGRRVSLSIYGVNDLQIEESDFRFDPTAGSIIGAIRVNAAVTGLSGAAYINIGKGATTWYTYVNWQYNSHWESRQRA